MKTFVKMNAHDEAQPFSTLAPFGLLVGSGHEVEAHCRCSSFDASANANRVEVLHSESEISDERFCYAL